MSCGDDDRYNTSLPCDDAESQSDNFVSIFDGVGQCGVWSGKFARYLAQFSKKEADIDLLPASLLPGQNRSDNILQEAHQHAWARLNTNNPLTSSGASTAVVLSLVSRPEDRHSLHQYVYGDSRWALLRNEGRGYKCLYISPDMKAPGTNAPLQLQAITTRRKHLPPIVMEREVMEDDVIIAGSDGLFDNLILGPTPLPGAGKLRQPKLSDEEVNAKLRKRLEDHVRDTVQMCKGACAVCEAMNQGGGGGRASVLCIGESIQRVVASNMKLEHAARLIMLKSGDPFTGWKQRGCNPDDLTIFVTRVSMGRLPDLPKNTCAAMKEASTRMKRQEGASAWHDTGIFKAQAYIAKDMQARGATEELQAKQQRLRQAVVDPEGYRTFETCHVRTTDA
ncbi:hypothetical protein T484DRAFT_1942681 [Baffinella frigidus]|nr:hypothetical protein T484DRAFT_1942681 [Cryptophyta sp. CCMP2293]